MKTLGGSHVAAAVIGCVLTNMAWLPTPDTRVFLGLLCLGTFIGLMVAADYESGGKR